MIRKNLYPFSIFILAFAVRFIYLNQIAVNSPFFKGLVLDSLFYDNWARQIASGNWLGGDVPYGSIAYPYFLAIAYKFLGHNLYMVRYLQFIFGSLSCVLIYLLGRKIFNKRVGIIASGMAVFYAPFIFHEGLLMPAFLSIFLDCLALLVILKAMENPVWWRWISGGVMLGLGSLVTPGILLFVPLVVAGIIAIPSRTGVSPVTVHNRRAALYAISLCIGLMLVMLPVGVRNYLAGKKFVFIPAHGGINFYIGNNLYANGSFDPPKGIRTTQEGLLEDSKLIAQRKTLRNMDLQEVSRFWFMEGVRFIKEYPFKYLLLLLRKFLLFWNGYEVSDVENYYFCMRYSSIISMLVQFSFVSWLSLLGLLLSLKNWDRVLPLYLFLFAWIIACLSFFVNARYRLNAVPVLIIFASYALYWWFNQWKNKNYKGILFSAALSIPVFLIVNMRIITVDYSGSFNTVGTIYARDGLYNEAIDQFQKAIRFRPDYAQAYANLGDAYMDKGMLNKAIEEYKKAIGLEPDAVHLHCNLAILYMKAGEEKNALNECEIVLRIDPSNEVAKKIKLDSSPSLHSGSE
ncbi:MAG: tetratricopeptide repeat protein [Candidatus Omnitrophica bacterium]|nr:tetratricopeptide repeat protein [Candidatus Omnitrophota bacterium]